MRAERLVGILLIVCGVVLLVVFQTGVGADAIPLLVGLAFLVAYAATRQYGLLIPGGILAGLGAGIVVAGADGPDTAPVLGLGAGFLAIFLIDTLVRGRRRGRWWPLIPGGILTALGLLTTPATRPAVRYLVPLALIVVGLWLVLSRRSRPGAPAREADAETVPE